MKDCPTASICIVTRNRREDLLRALRSCFAQSYRPLEVMVFDGHSSDGTAEAVRREFPSVLLVVLEEDPGFPALRNEGLRRARGAIVFTLDDDAFFTEDETITQAMADLEGHPEAAVLALPFRLPDAPARVLAQAARPLPPLTALRTFVACAAALRRDAVLACGGFRELLPNYKEDRDLSIRLLDRGWKILYGRSIPVVHVRHQGRNWEDRYTLDIRSSLVFDYLNIPRPYVLARMGMDAVQLLFYRLQPAAGLRRLHALRLALAACQKLAPHRAPVSRATYSLYRSLPPHGGVQ